MMLIGSVNSIDMEITRGLALPTVNIAAKRSQTRSFDLTGYTFTAQVFDFEGPGSTLLATLTVTAVSLSTGKISLDLSAASSAVIPVGISNGVLLMTATASGGDPKPWARGNVRFRG